MIDIFLITAVVCDSLGYQFLETIACDINENNF